MKTMAGAQSTYKTVVRNQSFLGFNKRACAWVGPFVMASVNANCVRRSQADMHFQ
jgi:hypothetical protein